MMNRPNKGDKRAVPQPGGEAVHDGEPAPLRYTLTLPPVRSRGRLVPVDDLRGSETRPPLNGPPAVADADFLTGDVGPATYQMPLPPVRSRGQLTPRPDWQIGEAAPSSSISARANRPLVPASEEVAKLPRGCREAFATRCAARVARLRPGAHTPEAAAALILAAATVGTPIRRQLLRIRRDFDRLTYLVRTHNWTDETVVPQDVFGPLWPDALTPTWAKEPEKMNSPAQTAPGQPEEKDGGAPPVPV